MGRHNGQSDDFIPLVPAESTSILFEIWQSMIIK